MKKHFVFKLSLFIFIFILTACANNTSSIEEENGKGNKVNSVDGKEKVVEITQVLDWFTQPVHGGFLAAQQQDYYKDTNLEVAIEAGGPQVNAVQIVASGKAQFGLASADTLLLARDENIPVVGIAAILQKGPASMFFHKGADIKSFADLNGRDVYASLATTNWQYLKQEYKLNDVKEIQFSGQYANFLADKESVTQGYATNTPFDLKQQGIEVDHLLVADSGYRPYYSIIFTTEAYLKENPEIVKNYIEASLKGYEYYQGNIEAVSELVKKENPDKDIESLNSEGKLQEAYIFGEEAKEHGIGYMTVERWQELADQLKDLKLLKQNLNVEDAFTTEYLPKK